MIRVLQLADVVNRYDFIDNIVQRADRSRFQLGVCVRSADSNIAPPIYPEDVARWILPGRSRWGIPRAAWQLAAILRRWKAHVVHTHHYDQAVIGWLATRLYPKARLVVGRHYSDAVYRSPSLMRRKALLALEGAVNRAAARIIAPSQYICQILTERQGVDAGKVDRVPYGFVAEKYRPPSHDEVRRLREQLGLNGQFVVGNFSRLHEEKGHRYLIEALAALRARLPRLAALIVGEGPERNTLQRQIRDADLGGVVRLLGWRRDAMTLMAAVDAVVQPTLQEAFSQVMAEALWMCKPLIITDVSGAPDVIRDGQNGLLIPKGDPAALADAVQRLARDDRLRARLGAAGRRHVEEHLTIDKVIPRYEQVYLRAAEG